MQSMTLPVSRGNIQIDKRIIISRNKRNISSIVTGELKMLSSYCPFGNETFSPKLDALCNKGIKQAPDFIYVLIDTSGSTQPTGGCRGCRSMSSGRDAQTTTQQENKTKENATKCIILSETEMISHILVSIANYYIFDGTTRLIIRGFSSTVTNCVEVSNANPEKIYDVAKNLDKCLKVEFFNTNTNIAIDSIKISENGNHLIILASDGNPNDEEATLKASIEMLVEATEKNAKIAFVTVGAGKVLDTDGARSDIFRRNLPISQDGLNCLLSRGTNSQSDQIVSQNYGRFASGWTNLRSMGAESCNVGFLTKLAQNSNNIGGAYIPAYGNYSEGIERFNEFIKECCPSWRMPKCPPYSLENNSIITLAYNAQKDTIINIPNIGEYLISFNKNTQNGMQVALGLISEEDFFDKSNLDVDTIGLLEMGISICTTPIIYDGNNEILDSLKEVLILMPNNKLRKYRVLRDHEGFIRRRILYKY